MDRHFVVNEKGRLYRSDEQGYTLIEVLVGGVLAAIFVVALFQIISQGSTLNRQQLLRRRAYQELDSVLEAPANSSLSPYYLSLATGDPLDTANVVLNNFGDTTSANNITATIKVYVDSVSFSYGGTVVPAKRVTATIGYADNGAQFLDSLQTLVTLADIN
jgi:Tfp pilus assembly protein PilV